MAHVTALNAGRDIHRRLGYDMPHTIRAPSTQHSLSSRHISGAGSQQNFVPESPDVLSRTAPNGTGETRRRPPAKCDVSSVPKRGSEGPRERSSVHSAPVPLGRLPSALGTGSAHQKAPRKRAKTPRSQDMKCAHNPRKAKRPHGSHLRDAHPP
eukprot:CAMPEP_0174336682 /NCGR_PEP_ID=MMETSP0810-20121108/21729_1 /TAXON_ID=73025 ORGANISM="Eutreptiella gymnastica-like, Strain CCMP1594" /NCGR_SAMPLE_ID=MMETSP0810 /ASSEMBLY_ACC=CAM_ASM_000659 /LENGTH=153 /DNA_ID=CAMNT_0015455709 /DNA_START=851 /DNA_END=1309 /DNA_ORIENTATION=-